MADYGLNYDLITLKGYDALQRRLAAVQGTVKDATLMKQLAALAVREQKSMLYHSFTRRTGATGASIVAQNVQPTSAAIYASKIAKFLDQGTGIYGPTGKKITPKTQSVRAAGPFLKGQKGQHRGGVLAWRTGGGSVLRATGQARSGKAGAGAGWAFARSVRGVKPHPFIVPGAERAVQQSGFAAAVIKAWDEAA